MSVLSNQNSQTTIRNRLECKSRNLVLQCQLKMFNAYGPQLGIYMLPQLQHELVWQGIIFVRNGYYKQGKFRFHVDLQDFPQRQPRIFFKTKMYHPLVDYKTGELDINAILCESWDNNTQNLLYNLMNQFNNIFTNNQMLENKASYNPQAAFLLQQNIREFLIKALECVELSNDSLNDYWEGSSLNTKEIDDNQKEDILQKLANVKGLSLKREQKIKILIQSLLF